MSIDLTTFRPYYALADQLIAEAGKGGLAELPTRNMESLARLLVIGLGEKARSGG